MSILFRPTRSEIQRFGSDRRVRNELTFARERGDLTGTRAQIGHFLDWVERKYGPRARRWMSVRIEAVNNEYLERTASAFNQNADYTWSVWMYYIGGGGVLYVGADADRANSDIIITGGSDDFQIHGYDNAAVEICFDGDSVTRATGTWYYVTMRRNGDNLGCYIDAVLSVENTCLVAGRGAAVRMNLGFEVAAGGMLDGRFAYSRVHNSALTTTQIGTERTSATAVVASPWHNTPLISHTDLTDNSGNGRGWSAVGTLSTEADPPAVLVGPTITLQPQSARVAVGASPTFTVTATGTGTIHYQWKKNGSNVGSDQNSYSFGQVALTDNNTTIQCVLTDNQGTTNTDLVVVAVRLMKTDFRLSGHNYVNY